MSSDIAIKVDNLSKCYHIYDKPRDRLMQMIVRKRKKYYREFWANQNVSFEIKKGETVGIVGRNGSGKSTLLQMICGTLNPTEGKVTTVGRIAALLELGSGFNPEFTGRENVYMNAAILGLTREETDARFSEILSFSEIGDFIDQPVKTYSSGMLIRLAFSVAINANPQILVIDEALSVGDELFQRKCFSRIESIKESGATILFVSHSGTTVVELCDRAILMDGGEKITEGSPKTIIGKYQKLLYAPNTKSEEIRNSLRSKITNEESEEQSESSNHQHAPQVESAQPDSEEFLDPNLQSTSIISYESHGAKILPPRIVNSSGEAVNCLVRGRAYRYIYNVDFSAPARHVRFGMLIKTPSGVELGGATSAADWGDAIAKIEQGSNLQVEFSFICNLNPGTYYLNAGVTGFIDSNETYLHRLLDACLFRVMPVPRNISTGTIDFKCTPILKTLGAQ